MNREALDLVGSAADVCNRQHGSPIRSTRSHNMDKALDGVDYVIVSISTGGTKAMHRDMEISEKYGTYHTVGDTVCSGGRLRAWPQPPRSRAWTSSSAARTTAPGC